MSNKGGLSGKHLAYKVLAHVRGIRESQRAIAAQLIEHMNSKTGACFPSMRLLADELRYSLPTIQIGIAALTDPNDPDRLFDNLNPGQGNLPDYEPRWSRFEELNAEIEARYLLSTVKLRANSSHRRTVKSAVNSNCMARAAVTVQHSANKTNLRTKGARPAAPQAAGPVRAPSKETAEKSALPMGPPVPLPPASEEAGALELPPTATVRRGPTEASRAHVSAMHEKFLREHQPVGPTWPRGGSKRP
ncbi:helix-turn-helix domain-containing protein [Mesorhizobium sp. CO1-1-11]|uniref:helix-turn-helix domain-containing protein n=1 Tax=Mesorhizobium sp. CO1-1-11 TaxID=2876636 RepID=UPI001CCEAAD3|nr:helix-turn-helix domain-containing protein [Mesorhizobium sp. CO1-1-11]MBZ9724872.1 helix-turn-helix domain-containing protein [Mesorhizobium sp. CO1-1-11]